MNREEMINSIQMQQSWDVVIIGGGASGLGAAIEATSRGYKTLLLEQHDFTKGTSSRSTKLVHGGVRYLAQRNIPLVFEALRERGLLYKNAPHLVFDLSLIIPAYSWWGIVFYTVGLTVYDLLARKLSFGRSLPQSKKKTLLKLPTLRSKNLRGGVLYHDGQFDDSRMGINMAQTIFDHGGTAVNYMKVTNLLKDEGKISRVVVIDQESERQYEIKSKVVVNATGVFVDNILQQDNPEAKDIVQPSQGIHLVLNKEFLPSTYGLMIPKTPDGRVLFILPWHDKVILGTTDVPIESASMEPLATDEEVDLILETASRYLRKVPKRSDVKSMFAGLRPLAATEEGEKTKEISRGHKIYESDSGLVTIIGGKWTTYRQMGQEVITRAAKVAGLVTKKSITRTLHIHGYQKDRDSSSPLRMYGADEVKIKKLISDDAGCKEWVSEELQIIKAQVVWAVRFEYARTIEDVLARRTRALFLDATESIRIAPKVADILASELDYPNGWKEAQVEAFKEIASHYLISNISNE
ncbi:MAG: glycerol-3-phosphate dehydrogenase/oxidase [Cytophagales bacterium]|nr:glycerol-3-phosphate dehydrogenase/oxidase [Cytophagales bacterium]